MAETTANRTEIAKCEKCKCNKDCDCEKCKKKCKKGCPVVSSDKSTITETTGIETCNQLKCKKKCKCGCKRKFFKKKCKCLNQKG